MLSQRKGTILKTIVDQYIANAVPVASEVIAGDYPVKISPATIRSEMAWLEDENYITRPHISAGGVPADRGYRYYVEALMGETKLPLNKQRTIRHLFYQVEQQVEEWVHLTAAILASEVMNITLVTLPKASECHLKHLELMIIREPLVLLIVLLYNTKIRQQLLSFDYPISQDELDVISSKLNTFYQGLTGAQIRADSRELSPVEARISQVLLQIMDSEDKQFGEPCLDGLRYFLNQPEFTRTKELWDIIEMLEERYLLKSILSTIGNQEGIQIIIGDENTDSALKKCSVVLGTYSTQEEAKGIIGVIGPTRMHYCRAISAVQYLTLIMNELLSGIYGQE